MKYYCKSCDYTTNRRNNFVKHAKTQKHKVNSELNVDPDFEIKSEKKTIVETDASQTQLSELLLDKNILTENTMIKMMEVLSKSSNNTALTNNANNTTNSNNTNTNTNNINTNVVANKMSMLLDKCFPNMITMDILSDNVLRNKRYKLTKAERIRLVANYGEGSKREIRNFGRVLAELLHNNCQRQLRDLDPNHNCLGKNILSCILTDSSIRSYQEKRDSGWSKNCNRDKLFDLIRQINKILIEKDGLPSLPDKQTIHEIAGIIIKSSVIPDQKVFDKILKNVPPKNDIEKMKQKFNEIHENESEIIDPDDKCPFNEYLAKQITKDILGPVSSQAKALDNYYQQQLNSGKYDIEEDE